MRPVGITGKINRCRRRPQNITGVTTGGQLRYLWLTIIAADDFDRRRANLIEVQRMPRAMRCTNCRLAIFAGWFHYSIGASPYWAATLLVCRRCGRAHAVEYTNEKPGYKDRFFYLGEPLGEPLVDDDEPEGSCDEEGSFLTMMWFPPFSEWDGGSEPPTDKIAELPCVHCGSSSLTDRWEKGWPCPLCGSEVKLVHSWIT